MALSRIVALAGFVLGLASLILQLWLSIPARMSQGRDLLDAMVWFLTYFTILTNIMLVLCYLSALSAAGWLGWWRSPVTRGMMAGAIALVMGFYHFVLAATWSPEGPFLVADVALHYATPALYLFWWLAFQPKGRLSWRDIPIMLVPPLLWLTWTMARGALATEYPYPVLEAHIIGYGAVLANIAGLLAVLAALFAIVIAIDRAMGRKRVASG